MITLSKMTLHEMTAERNDGGQETRQTDFQTDRLLDRQTFRQTDFQTDRLLDRMTADKMTVGEGTKQTELRQSECRHDYFRQD